jgi:precorrin-8X/cobalt-precorrin-8 methylmutase
MTPARFDYLRDPEAIEQASFHRIRELTRLDGLDADTAQLAMRLAHTCGEPDIVTDLALRNAPVAAGIAALGRAAPVLCDVEMVRHGLTRRFLGSKVYCHLHEAIPAPGETRTMAAVAHWLPRLDGAVAVIGNAPTALFRLLEHLHDGAPRPALVVGMPVGFVGAVESKAALLETAEALGIPAITVTGRRGGSALAAAAVNALARLQQGIRY